jgi:dihydrolipoamide dehydrogenase
MNVASAALSRGLRVAVIDNGPLGGTCLNRGCIPSKVLLHPADVIRCAQEAKAIGVEVTVDRVDFRRIMDRVWDIVLDGRREMEQGVAHADLLDYFNADAQFAGDFVLRVGRRKIRGDTIVIASGARPYVPPIEGIEDVGYLTSATVFDLETPPESLVIVGGGYIAVEFAHFFSAIGTQVTVVGRNPRLVPQEEPEISQVLGNRLARYCDLVIGAEVVGASRDGGRKSVRAREASSGREHVVRGQEILLAAGRRSNADILQPQKSGVKTDSAGWIEVDEYLQTSQPDIWALGDALGRQMFRHNANYQADLVWWNAFTEHKHPVDQHAVPHAVFTHPEIASVGLTQAEAMEHHAVYVGASSYRDTAKGFAAGEEDGFVKVIVEEGTRRILGAHAIGPQASLLIQPLVYLMNAGDQTYEPLARSQTIHPSLGEVVIRAFGNLQPVGQPDHAHHHHG